MTSDNYISSLFGQKIAIDVQYKAKLSTPKKQSPSPEGAVGNSIEPPEYTDVQHDTWNKLFTRQDVLVEGKVCKEYLAGKKKLPYSITTIPNLKDLSNALKSCTGWQLIRVEGYVPEDIFFKLLANKHFPSTDFIRHPDELEYTPAPDMFHDLVGHLPLITNPTFAEFFHTYGQAGLNAKTEDDIKKLGRIYWHTVEFGLMNPTAHNANKRDASQTRVYGAGISSSVGELVYSLSDKPKIYEFEIDRVAAHDFDIHHMQDYFFEISSFDELLSEFHSWAKRNHLLNW